jgi:hypothetical protein
MMVGTSAGHEDDPTKAAIAYTNQIKQTILKAMENQPTMFRQVELEEWDDIIHQMQMKIKKNGYKSRRFDCRSSFPEIFTRRVLFQRPSQYEPTAGFIKDHRSEFIDGAECISYSGCLRGELNRRQTRLEEVVGTTDRRRVLPETFILYMWTLSYKEDVKFPGLGKWVCPNA